jgi:hypothetical protein
MAKLRTEYSHSSFTKNSRFYFLSCGRWDGRVRLIFLLTQSLIRLSPCMTLWWKWSRREGDGGRGETWEPKYAVVPWGDMNAESWRHTTPLSSTYTVLYRYNTVRNDFVDLIKFKIQRRRLRRVLFTNTTKNVRILNERKAGATALLTSSTATDQRCH